ELEHFLVAQIVYRIARIGTASRRCAAVDVFSGYPSERTFGHNRVRSESASSFSTRFQMLDNEGALHMACHHYEPACEFQGVSFGRKICYIQGTCTHIVSEASEPFYRLPHL